jgi:putative FmdB family regulatory protein
MPIYEFKCNQCNTQFEQLCRLDWQGTVACPACGSKDLAKALSAFCSPGSGGGKSCAGCAGGNCGSCH